MPSERPDLPAKCTTRMNAPRPREARTERGLLRATGADFLSFGLFPGP